MITSSGLASVRKLRRIVKIFPATSVMQYVERLTIAVCLPGKRAYYYPAYTQTHASISNVIYNSYVLYVLMWNNNECMRKIHPNWRHIIFAYSFFFFYFAIVFTPQNRFNIRRNCFGRISTSISQFDHKPVWIWCCEIRGMVWENHNSIV